MKKQHPDALLFFRMGDFFELFFEDAKIASRALGIALTSRSKGEGAVPMAGVPVRSADGSVAFVRHERTSQGMRSEIWVAPPGAAARLLVPIWERVTPVSVP